METAACALLSNRSLGAWHLRLFRVLGISPGPLVQLARVVPASARLFPSSFLVYQVRGLGWLILKKLSFTETQNAPIHLQRLIPHPRLSKTSDLRRRSRAPSGSGGHAPRAARAPSASAPCPQEGATSRAIPSTSRDTSDQSPAALLAPPIVSTPRPAPPHLCSP